MFLLEMCYSYPRPSCLFISDAGHTKQMETPAAATANQNPGSLACAKLNSALALKAQLQSLQVEEFVCLVRRQATERPF